MGKIVGLSTEDFACSATINTYITFLAFIAADTAGHRFKLLGLSFGVSEDAPVDETFSVLVKRIADLSAGGAGTKTAVAAANLSKQRSNQTAGNITGAIDYTVEPTAYETYALPGCMFEFNSRGTIWVPIPENIQPEFERDQVCGILVAPRVATSRNLSVGAVIEEL